MADPLLIVIIALAIGFGLVNGFNDAANAVAASIGSRALSPLQAILLAASANAAGAATGTAVAITIGKGILAPEAISFHTIIAGLSAIIIWGSIATRYGLPVSITHGFISGIGGAGAYVGGIGAINWGVMRRVLISVVTAPTLGFVGAFGIMLAIYWALRNWAPTRPRTVFGRLHWVTTGFLAYSHGKNDGQMPIGVITMALVAQSGNAALWDNIPVWVIAVSAAAISIGTAVGGWRVIKTMGIKITALDTPQSFTADIAAASVIEGASELGIPVSTTHCSSAAIMGVGATRRLSAVRWGVARRIVAAWILTFPICGGIGYLVAMLSQPYYS